MCASLLSLIIGSKYYYMSPLYHSHTHAIATIHPTENNSAKGTVRFHKSPQGIHITAQISGLTPGIHGFHIHEFGDCSCKDASCAGGHFNPTNAQHGPPNQAKSHRGDLGNIHADNSGNAFYDSVNKYIQLNGPNSIIGRALIIHENADDLSSQPTGNSGARVGCGIIGIDNATNY